MAACGAFTRPVIMLVCSLVNGRDRESAFLCLNDAGRNRAAEQNWIAVGTDQRETELTRIDVGARRESEHVFAEEQFQIRDLAAADRGELIYCFSAVVHRSTPRAVPGR